MDDKPTQVYKNANWAERKRELKSTRNQRTSKSIKNIRVIDTPADPSFNCIPPLTKIHRSKRLLPLANP